MIKLSELKAGISNPDTLNSLYLNDNNIVTIEDRDLIVSGEAAFKVTAANALILANGTEGTIGHVWTALDENGRGGWGANPVNLQYAYDGLPEIITSIVDAYGHGNVIISGSEGLEVTATKGIITELLNTLNGDLIISGLNDFNIQTDLYIDNNSYFYGNIQIQDGSEGTSGDVWTSVDAYGNGSWVTPVTTFQLAYEFGGGSIVTSNTYGDINISGTEKMIVSTSNGFEVNTNLICSSSVTINNELIIKDGSQGIIGDVWTSTGINGEGSWISPVTTFQAAYEFGGGNIVTNDAYGDITISGTELFNIQIPSFFTEDAYFATELWINNNFKYTDGLQNDGYFLKSDSLGNGSWTQILDNDIEVSFSGTSFLDLAINVENALTFLDAAIQVNLSEIDSLETSLGSAINNDGSFNTFTGSLINSVSTFTDAIENLNDGYDSVKTNVDFLNDGYNSNLIEIDTIEGTLGLAINGDGSFGGFIGSLIGTVSTFTQAIENLNDGYDSNVLEVDTIEGTLGAAINGDGSFGGFLGSIIGVAVTFTQAIEILDDGYAALKDNLDNFQSDSGLKTNSSTLVWAGTAPTSIIASEYRWIRTGNKVDVWFNAKYNAAGSSTTVDFDLPADCPTPTTWTNHSSDDVIEHGSGSLIDDGDSYFIDHSIASLIKTGSTYTIKIQTFAGNTYGAPGSVNAIGFNAHISYFTN